MAVDPLQGLARGIVDENEVRRLRAENARLRDLLWMREEQRAAMFRVLGLQPQTSQLVAMLYAAGGRWVLLDWLLDAFPRDWPGEPYSNYIAVHVSLARRVLGREGIEARGDRGVQCTRAYRLSKDAMARLRPVMESAA